MSFKQSLGCSILVLVVNVYLTFAVEPFIEKWRNEPAGKIIFYRGSLVGSIESPFTASRTEVSQTSMVKCIEKLRDEDNETKSSGIIQFNKIFEFFGKCFCSVIMLLRSGCAATIDYSDKELQYRHFERFKVKQTLGALEYFDQSNLPEKKENVFVKTITNRGTKNVKSTAVLSFAKTDGTATSFSNELGASITAKVKVNLPFYSFESEFESSYSYTRSETKKEENTDTFSLEREFDIPANKAVQIVCSLKKQDFDLAWEIPVIVTGAVAIKANRFANGKPEYLFVDVKHAARYFTELSLTRDDPPKLQGFIRGRTTGSKHYDAEVNPQTLPLSLTPVQKDICNPLPSKA